MQESDDRVDATEAKMERAEIYQLEDELRNLDQQIRYLQGKRAALSARIDRLHAAAAAYKCLPPEILTFIFLLTIPPLGVEQYTQTSQRTTTPWTLRSICSSWRKLALSTPELWGTLHFEVGREVPVDGLCRRVPPTGLLVISASVDAYKESTLVLKQLVIPNLFRLRGLHLDLPASSFSDLLEIDSSALSELTTVKLTLQTSFLKYRRQNVQEGPGTFLPFLERLIKLESLELATGISHSLTSAFISDLLDCRFPRTYLTDLNLFGLDGPGKGEVEDILQRFPKLQRLAVMLQWQDSAISGVRLHLPDLRYLVYGHYERDSAPGLGFEPINIAWEKLIDLDLEETVTVPRDFFPVLRQCISLRRFRAEIRDAWAIGTETIQLPYLSSLTLTLRDGRILNDFLLPKLELLHVNQFHGVGYAISLAATEISSLITRSRCVLLALSLDALPSSSDGNTLQELLSIVSPELRKLTIKYRTVDAEIMKQIGSGRLLPRLSEFDCYVASSTGFVEMLRHRMELENLYGVTTVKVDVLRKAHGILLLEQKPGILEQSPLKDVSRMKREAGKALELRLRLGGRGKIVDFVEHTELKEVESYWCG
ncbi:hypothetical protein DXG03_002113 [Asterophora parasitica]|uniref:F-box domain-containing protein n=1 Tax=Asterophora parasitica TaxID=117018 RepID=A0A9P7G2N9_9AGAR|nr:hypothetical protein DXG03_002113 [Asterophora parasitica]